MTPPKCRIIPCHPSHLKKRVEQDSARPGARRIARQQLNVIGGWLPSLTFAIDASKRMKTPKLLLTTIVLLGLCGRLGIAAETNRILPQFELMLGIRTGECARGVRDPPEFGVRNLSA